MNLKERIHKFRIPLGPGGKLVMGAIYFSVPLYVGLQIMDWANNRSEEKWKDAVAGKTRRMGTVDLPDIEERRKATEKLAAFVKAQHEASKK